MELPSEGLSFTPDPNFLPEAMSIIRGTCYVVAVILIMMQGIRFLIAAPDGKAKVKEDLSKIFIGSTLLVSTGAVISIVEGLTADLAGSATPTSALAKVLGAAQTICYVVAVILIMWMGVKWLTTAPEGKAELKKGLLIAAIGSALLVGAGTILMALGNAGGEMLS